MNIAIISLGCAKNLVDSELFLGLSKIKHSTISHKATQPAIYINSSMNSGIFPSKANATSNNKKPKINKKVDNFFLSFYYRF